MSRKPLVIDELPPDYFVTSRCFDGKIELMVYGGHNCFIREISPSEALAKGMELVNYARQMLDSGKYA